MTVFGGRGGKVGNLTGIQRLWAPLEMVTCFIYLGIVISASENDWPAVIHNMVKARAVWSRMIRILSREG